MKKEEKEDNLTKYLKSASKQEEDNLIFPEQDFQTLAMNLQRIIASRNDCVCDGKQLCSYHAKCGYPRGWHGFKDSPKIKKCQSAKRMYSY